MLKFIGYLFNDRASIFIDVQVCGAKSASWTLPRADTLHIIACGLFALLGYRASLDLDLALSLAEYGDDGDSAS